MASITIEISEPQAAALTAQANAQGLTLADWLLRLAEQHTPIASEAELQTVNPEEWARRFYAWAEGHDRTTPLLSDEALSRESIYPDPA